MLMYSVQVMSRNCYSTLYGSYRFAILIAITKNLYRIVQNFDELYLPYIQTAIKQNFECSNFDKLQKIHQI